MKASEMIHELQSLKDKYGDCELYSRFYDPDCITDITYEEIPNRQTYPDGKPDPFALSEAFVIQ